MTKTRMVREYLLDKGQYPVTIPGIDRKCNQFYIIGNIQFYDKSGFTLEIIY